VLAAANLDPAILGSVSKKLDDVLDGKNGAIKDLQVGKGGGGKYCVGGWMGMVEQRHQKARVPVGGKEKVFEGGGVPPPARPLCASTRP
jgi:hypothetical protein